MARKKKQLPILEKVTITDVAAEGKAIARVNDMVVFVPFVAPGDVVDIQLTRKKNSYAEGKPVYFHEYLPNVRSRFVSTSVSVEVASGNIFPMRNNFTISKNRSTIILPASGKSKWKRNFRS